MEIRVVDTSNARTEYRGDGSRVAILDYEGNLTLAFRYRSGELQVSHTCPSRTYKTEKGALRAVRRWLESE